MDQGDNETVRRYLSKFEHPEAPTSDHRGIVESFCHSAIYSMVQAPLNGIRQLEESVIGLGIPECTLLERPKYESITTATGMSQLAGSAVGMLLPFIGFCRATSALARVTGATIGLTEGAVIRKIGETNFAAARGAFVGASYAGIFQEVQNNPTGLDMVTARMHNAFTSGLTFGVMGALSARLAIGPGPDLTPLDALKMRMTIGGMVGLAGGFVHAEADSLLSGKGLADGRQLAETAAGFAIVGSGLGALHPILEPEPYRVLAEAERFYKEPKISGSSAPTAEAVEPLKIDTDVIEYKPDCVITKKADGTVIENHHGGRLRVTKYVDGTVEELSDHVFRRSTPDGADFIQYKPGHETPGYSLLNKPDGSCILQRCGYPAVEIVRPRVPGATSVHVQKQGDTWVRTYSEGTTEARNADGNLEMRRPDGTVIVERPSTSSNSSRGDIDIETRLPDGSVKVVPKWDYRPESMRLTHWSRGDGYTKTGLQNGRVTLTYKDGLRVVRDEGGWLTWRNKQGKQIYD